MCKFLSNSFSRNSFWFYNYFIAFFRVQLYHSIYNIISSCFVDSSANQPFWWTAWWFWSKWKVSWVIWWWRSPNYKPLCWEPFTAGSVNTHFLYILFGFFVVHYKNIMILSTGGWKLSPQDFWSIWAYCQCEDNVASNWRRTKKAKKLWFRCFHE